MKNLELYNVQQLNDQELSQIHGGWAKVLLGVLSAVAKEVISDWDNFKAGMNGEAPVDD